MEEEDNRRKRPLQLDWEVVLGQNDDEEPPQLLVVKDNTSLKPYFTTAMSDDQCFREDLMRISDRDLNEKIKRQRQNLQNLGNSLPDKGVKLQDNLKLLEEERDRRKFRRPEIDVDKYEKPSASTCPNEDGLREESEPSQDNSQSEFASILIQKLDEKPDNRTVTAFDKELSTLGRQYHQNTSASLQKRRDKGQSSARVLPFRSVSSLYCNGGKHDNYNGDQKGRPSSVHTTGINGNDLSVDFFSEQAFRPRKDGCQVFSPSSSKLKKGLTVVLVDEDETEDVESKQFDECMKDAKIYYPSRDDPDSAEICYTDIKCLAPDGFLTSSIMNFYIRYLQIKASPTSRAIKDCHFFNTFFYSKLTEAVSYKGNDQKSNFLKFRRWWRGVNLFEKAYILIPINEDLHWSLTIICIPDKEDEIGPVILHLDSLGIHRSKYVFDNIKSFLKEEWSYVSHEILPIDLPIADRIWRHLPRRIEEKVISVPQQKNDSDCGLFVLYFMERFIKEAPERLRKRNLAMFGKQWFRPEEASGLRVKIRNLLKDEFQSAKR